MQESDHDHVRVCPRPRYKVDTEEMPLRNMNFELSVNVRPVVVLVNMKALILRILWSACI